MQYFVALAQFYILQLSIRDKTWNGPENSILDVFWHTLDTFVAIFDLLPQYYVGHCRLSEVETKGGLYRYRSEQVISKPSLEVNAVRLHVLRDSK
jgi:hypothetical protein